MQVLRSLEGSIDLWKTSGGSDIEIDLIEFIEEKKEEEEEDELLEKQISDSDSESDSEEDRFIKKWILIKKGPFEEWKQRIKNSFNIGQNGGSKKRSPRFRDCKVLAAMSKSYCKNISYK